EGGGTRAAGPEVPGPARAAAPRPGAASYAARRRARPRRTSPRGTGAPSRWRRRSARAGRARAAVAAPRGSPSATGPPQIGPAGDARAAPSAVPCCSRCPAVLRDWGRGAAQPGRRSDDGGSRPHAGCNRRAPRAGASPRTPWRGPPLAVALKRLRQEPEGERLICEHMAQTHLARHPLDVGLHEVEILRVAQPHGVQALGFGLTHVPGRRLGVGIGVFVMIAQRLPVLVPGALYGGPDVVARERHRIRYRPSFAWSESPARATAAPFPAGSALARFAAASICSLTSRICCTASSAALTRARIRTSRSNCFCRSSCVALTRGSIVTLKPRVSDQPPTVTRTL